MSAQTDTEIVFDCPLHGFERTVFCFRAFDERNRHRWLRRQIEYTLDPISDDEYNANMANIRNVYT